MTPTITRTSPDLTLFRMERELLELLQLRDDVAEEICVDIVSAAAREESLQAIDNQIVTYVQRLAVTKADSFIMAVRELAQREETLDHEITRLTNLRDYQRTRLATLKSLAANTLAATLEPAAIVQATQGTVLKRVRGQVGQLKLHKSPVSVDVVTPALLPAAYQQVTLTMPLDVYELLPNSVDIAVQEGVIKRSEPQPRKGAIKEELLKVEDCRFCGATGVYQQVSDDLVTESWPCAECNGTGKQRGTVAGARLICDAVHVRIS